MSVIDNDENLKLCLCPDCPTYKKSNLTGILFCAKGKAKEKVKSVSCNCPTCAVFAKNGLNQMYYCIIGKAADNKP
jgi:methylamine---glutamate N-methyltransferase subunit C